MTPKKGKEMSIFYDLMFIGLVLMTAFNTTLLLVSKQESEQSKLSSPVSGADFPLVKPGTRTTFNTF
jgi:hypothetical protein